MRQRHTRLNIAGSNHFVTTVARIRGFRFCDDEDCRNVLRCFEYYREQIGLDCVGFVLMPDHFHALLHQGSTEASVSKLMRSFKQHTSSMLGLRVNLAQTLWHPRYDDVLVPGGACHVKLDYMHNNPIKAGLVRTPEEYRRSSYRDYFDIERGIVTIQRL